MSIECLTRSSSGSLLSRLLCYFLSFLRTTVTLMLMFFQIVEYFFFFLDLPTVVLGFFVGDLDLEFIIIKLLLLSFNLDTQIDVIFFKAFLFFFDIFTTTLLRLRRLVQNTIRLHTISQFVYQILALLCEHLYFNIFIYSFFRDLEVLLFFLSEL